MRVLPQAHEPWCRILQSHLRRLDWPCPSLLLPLKPNILGPAARSCVLNAPPRHSGACDPRGSTIPSACLGFYSLFGLVHLATSLQLQRKFLQARRIGQAENMLTCNSIGSGSMIITDCFGFTVSAGYTLPDFSLAL